MTQAEMVPPLDGVAPLKAKVALVTGAAKGLGAKITEGLAAQGASLALLGRDGAALEAHGQDLDARFTQRESLVLPCDVMEEDAVLEATKKAVDRFGGLDILVNTAGGIGPIETPAQEVPVEEFRNVLELNVLGTFVPCKAAIPFLIQREGGRIVNIAGTSGLRGYRNRVGYSSSKWAVRGLTRTLALELGQYGITVNTVCPNVTHGERMTRIITEKARRTGRTPDEVYQDFASQTALGRFVDDVDIAAAVLFLVSEGARNVTGHDIVVDAGWDI